MKVTYGSDFVQAIENFLVSFLYFVVYVICAIGIRYVSLLNVPLVILECGSLFPADKCRSRSRMARIRSVKSAWNRCIGLVDLFEPRRVVQMMLIVFHC